MPQAGPSSEPRRAGSLRLHNTMTHEVEAFAPADPDRVTFYTCGPTVYDDAHIGNFRSFLAADLLRRFIESPLCTVVDASGAHHAGPRRVEHVMNITDVGHMTDDSNADGGGEDKMALAGQRLLEAKKAGRLPAGASVDASDPYAIADFYADRFLEDARALGLKVAIEQAERPEVMPRPTRCIPEMLDLVRTLLNTKNDAGEPYAYEVGANGRFTVYFNVQAFPAYGRLSGNTLDKLKAGAGGRVSEGNQSQKRHPADFLLWKSDPAHVMKWHSPWGEGYPGWHLECSVMADRFLNTNGSHVIDLHSGGEDNIFPHHECEVAQSCAAHGTERFSRTWFHPRFLFVDGKKMSKSAGTFFTARELFEKGVEPGALRLELIRTHYRSNANFSEQGLKDSARMVDRWRRFVAEGEASSDAGVRNDAVRDSVADAMHDDLNIAGALGAINKWIAETPKPTKADADLMREFDGFLGVLSLAGLARTQTGIGVYTGGLSPTDEVEDLLARRRDARAAKDFATADAIRDELSARGLAIKDIAGGQVEVSPA